MGLLIQDIYMQIEQGTIYHTRPSQLRYIQYNVLTSTVECGLAMTEPDVAAFEVTLQFETSFP